MEPLFSGRVYQAGCGDVARKTFDVCVPAFEQEPRALVVKHTLWYRAPITRRMTLVATPGKGLCVRVTVTRCACRKLHAPVENGAGMTGCPIVALLARHLHVLAGQRVPGTLMRKQRRRLPPFRVMARGTGSGELTTVNVRMTGDARGREPEQRLGPLALEDFHPRGGHVTPRMAGIAPDACVFSLQGKTARHAMIKCRGVESHNLEVFSVVIAVTISTPLVAHMGMDSPCGVDPGLEFLVAFETSFIRQGLPVWMTRRAFIDSFQVVVRTGKPARRDLRPCRKRYENGENQHDPACGHSATPHITEEDRGGNMDQKNDQQYDRKWEMNDMPVLECTLELFKKQDPAMQNGPSSGNTHACRHLVDVDPVR